MTPASPASSIGWNAPAWSAAPGARPIAAGCFAVLTSAGEQRLAADVPDIVDAIERSLTGVLTAEQLDAFVGALQTVRDTVHPRATAGAQR